MQDIHPLISFTLFFLAMLTFYTLLAAFTVWQGGKEKRDKRKVINELKKEKKELVKAKAQYQRPAEPEVFNDDDPGEEMYVLGLHRKVVSGKSFTFDDTDSGMNFLCKSCEHRHSIPCSTFTSGSYRCPGDYVVGEPIYTIRRDFKSRRKEATK